MNILFVTNFSPPTHAAGTETYTHGIARALRMRGHDVHVLCAGRWDEGKHYWNGFTAEAYDGVTVSRLHLNWTRASDPNRYLYDNPVVAAHLRAYLDVARPDIVHVTSCYTLSGSVLRTCKEIPLPVVVTLTDFWFLCPRLTLLRSDGELCGGQTTPQECLRCLMWDTKVYRIPARLLPEAAVLRLLKHLSHYRWLTRWRGLRGMAIDIARRKQFLEKTLAMADRVIVPSAFLRDVFLANHFALPFQVSPYGHDLSWLRPDLRQLTPAPLRFGYVGQIDPAKGVHILIRAFKAAAFDGEASLSIHGDFAKQPAYSRELSRLAAGDPSIEFGGAFPHARLGEILAKVDVLVVPSLWYENNPLVIQEAFAAGIPVIASNLGGMREFVRHGTDGLLFERGHVQDAAFQLRRAAFEPGLLERLRSGVPPVRRAEEEVLELERTYREASGR